VGREKDYRHYEYVRGATRLFKVPISRLFKVPISRTNAGCSFSKSTVIEVVMYQIII
jgi:hypothetical protein